MRSIGILLLAVAVLVGLTTATVVMGTVVSTLGLAFLAMIAVIGLVIAAAGKRATSKDESS